jgi:hypothetical protein
MKHRNKSASSGELACPHLSDHPTRQAKPTSYDPTDELCTFSAQFFAVRLSTCSACSAYPFEKDLALSPQPSALGLHLSSLRRYFAMSPRRRSAVRPSFQKHTEHTENTRQTHPKHTQKHSPNTQKPQQNTRKHTKHTPFFVGRPPIDFPSAYLPQFDL